MESSNNLLLEIDELNNKYYNKNTKNIFFKKQQKKECANYVRQNIEIDILLRATIFIIPNTSHIYFDYTLLKTYAMPDLYQTMIKYAITLFDECIQKYDMYEMHINLNTFTLSALERHYDVVRIFCEECLRAGQCYSEKLTKLHIYYIPSIFDKMSLLLDKFIHEEVKKKIVKYTKEESEIVTTKLYELCNKIE
jgi:hypothetical protein